MRKYSFCLTLSLLPIILTTQSFGQSNENQLFIIKTVRQYKGWLYDNKELYLVPLDRVIMPIISEVPYRTQNNFTGQQLYRNHSFWVAREVGSMLKNVQDSLRKRGLSLYFYDTYRPYAVTEKMWKIVPDERYAANPANGSGHNRGISVDVSLADLSTGKPLKMPTGYDNFSDTAHHNFMNLSEEVLFNREILKNIMEYYGFRALSTEWWHYSLPNGQRYPLLNLKFRKLKKVPLPRHLLDSGF
jgi:zinc D-Ala-D-Ala dipeptidase